MRGGGGSVKKMLDREKLAKVVEMFQSPFEHEVLNAVRKANKMVADASMTWTEALCPYEAMGGETQDEVGDTPKTSPKQTDQDRACCAMADSIMNDGGFTNLNENSQDFVEEMATRWKRSVSPRQRDWLYGIADKMGIAPCAS